MDEPLFFVEVSTVPFFTVSRDRSIFLDEFTENRAAHHCWTDKVN